MIKFWIVDFSYEKRLGHSEPFGYVFHVSGESANYLMNKYRLSYPRVFVSYYLDKTIYILAVGNMMAKEVTAAIATMVIVKNYIISCSQSYKVIWLTTKNICAMIRMTGIADGNK